MRREVVSLLRLRAQRGPCAVGRLLLVLACVDKPEAPVKAETRLRPLLALLLRLLALPFYDGFLEAAASFPVTPSEEFRLGVEGEGGDGLGVRHHLPGRFLRVAQEGVKLLP